MNVFGARPDLLLVVVLLWATLRGGGAAAAWGFWGGLVVDLLSGGALGVTILPLVVVASIAAQPIGRALGSEVVRLVLLTLICASVYHVIRLTLLVWTGHTVAWEYSLFHTALPSILLTMVLVPLLYAPMMWFERKTRREVAGLKGLQL